MLASVPDDPRQAGTIWTLDLEQPPPVVSPLLPVSFQRLGQASLPAIAGMSGRNGSAREDRVREMRLRLETGKRCYAAWVEGKPAAYGWVSFNEEFVGEMSLHLRLLPGEAYIWDCFTLPAFRGRRMYSALLAYILGELRSEKYSRAWIGADLDNTASQRGIARAGFLHVADLVVERTHAMRMVWVQPQPGAPASLVAEAQRVFLGSRTRAWREALPEARWV